jgi:hypothetical protein
MCAIRLPSGLLAGLCAQGFGEVVVDANLHAVEADHLVRRIQSSCSSGVTRYFYGSTRETDCTRSIVRSKESTRRTPVDSAFATR